MIRELLVAVLFCTVQSVVLIFSAISLFTNQWARDVDRQHQSEVYFRKVENDPNLNYILTSSSEAFDSMGLWRIYGSDESYPLPIVDPEVQMIRGTLIAAMVLGLICLYVSSFQFVGLLRGLVFVELLFTWSTAMQGILTAAGAAMGMSYFNSTVKGGGFGFSLFAAWIAFVFNLMALVATVFKVIFARKSSEELEKEKIPGPVYEKLTLRSSSENHLYNAPPTHGSRPGTGERSMVRDHNWENRGSRPGTMQSQQHYEPGMRRAASYENRLESDMHDYRAPPRGPASPRAGGRQQGYADSSYDQGDIPKYMR